MAQMDLYNNFTPVSVFSPRIVDEDGVTQAAAFSTSGYESTVIVISTGTLAGSGGEFSFLLYESNVIAGPFTVVPMEDIQTIYPETEVTNGFPQIDGEEDENKIYKVGYIGAKKYLLLFMAALETDGNNGLPIGVTALQGNPNTSPTPEDLN